MFRSGLCPWVLLAFRHHVGQGQISAPTALGSLGTSVSHKDVFLFITFTIVLEVLQESTCRKAPPLST